MRTEIAAGVTGGRCPLCGCAELRVDEVFDRGLLRLEECAHCGHRRTAWVALRGRPLLRSRALELEEVAAA